MMLPIETYENEILKYFLHYSALARRFALCLCLTYDACVLRVQGPCYSAISYF